MLTKRYMTTTKNLPAILARVQEGVAPERFTVQHLTGLGFGSSNDRAAIPVLKDLGFLSGDGTPTPIYHAYRNKANGRTVLGAALKQAYGDLFTISEHPTDKDRPQIVGKFKSVHNVSDDVAERQALTFYSLLSLADIDGVAPASAPIAAIEPPVTPNLLPQNGDGKVADRAPLALSYTIQIHLPATSDVSVYNAIFKSVRENLLD